YTTLFRSAVGDSETTTFEVVADDGSGNTDTNSNFSVESISANDIPVIGGITTTQIFDNMTARPFGGITVVDPDPGTLLDVTVTLLTTNGTLGGNHGTMQLSGGFVQNTTSTFTLS